MRGKHAFEPSTGALLADQRERPGYLPTHAPIRAPEPDQFNEAPTEPYSCGANFSSSSALIGYFRRMHDQHTPDPNPTMDRQAALAIKRLKEPESDIHDDYCWFAIAERLLRHDDYSRDELGWMHSCVQVGCPSCYSKLKWEQDIHGRALGKCSKHCETAGMYVNDQIREIIRERYNRVFRPGDLPPIDSLRFLE